MFYCEDTHTRLVMLPEFICWMHTAAADNIIITAIATADDNPILMIFLFAFFLPEAKQEYH